MVELTRHASAVAAERRIRVAWIRRVVEVPERLEFNADGTLHYLLPIAERDGRWLRVVAVEEMGRMRVITAFFDRRLSRTAT